MRIIYVVLIFFFIFSCKNATTNDGAVSVTSASETSTATTDAPKSYDVNDLTKYVGQMPSEANIFQVANLAERTKSIMGKNFIDFESGWFDKLPIKQYEDYIYFGGCEFENCEGVKYFIMVDLTEDNLNVLHYGGKRPYSFEEGAIIGMPNEIADAFDRFRK